MSDSEGIHGRASWITFKLLHEIKTLESNDQNSSVKMPILSLPIGPRGTANSDQFMQIKYQEGGLEASKYSFQRPYRFFTSTSAKNVHPRIPEALIHEERDRFFPTKVRFV